MRKVVVFNRDDPVFDISAVASLKEEAGADLLVMGSGELVGSLITAGLVDQLTLLIHPLVMGSGRRMFWEGRLIELQLLGTATNSKGVIIATYRPST